MSDAKHTPPGDASFRSSLVRNGVGALGLVVIVAAAFWAVGTLGGEDGTPLVSDDAPPADETSDPEGPPAEADDGSATPEDDVTDGDAAADATDATGEADTDAEDEGPAGGDDGEAEDGEAQDGDAEDDAAEDDEGADDEPAVAPSEVTIQVLDGFKEDGGAAADEVAELLTSAGYDVIARNDAISYDATTVLYNAGNEEAARQVAAELGGAEVREQPGNLSTSVALHVVVGRDRG